MGQKPLGFRRFATLRKIWGMQRIQRFLESNQKYRSPKPGFIWSLLCPFLWRHLPHPSRYICSEGPSRATGDTQIKVLRNELKRRFLIPGWALRESKIYRVLFLCNKLNTKSSSSILGGSKLVALEDFPVHFEWYCGTRNVGMEFLDDFMRQYFKNRMDITWYNLIQIDTTTAMGANKSEGRLTMLLPQNARIEPFVDRGDCVSLTFLDPKSHLIHQFPKLSLRHLGSCRTGGIFFGHSSFQVCHTGALEGKFSSVNKDKTKRSWKITQERNLSIGISRPLWNVHQQQPRLLHTSRMNNVQGSVNEDGDLRSDAT